MQSFVSHLIGEFHSHVGAVFIFSIILAYILANWLRASPHKERLLNLRPPKFRRSLLDRRARFNESALRDTIFILPDISGFTRYVSTNQDSTDHSQYIIFELLNAIINAAGEPLNLSKIEGDAALFILDKNAVAPHLLGKKVMNMFQAFDRRKARLKQSNSCQCSACKNLDVLDIKIFIHRGKAAHFQFRGSTDVFGSEAIVLYRMIKNQVNFNRYVMITEAASESIILPITSHSKSTSFPVENCGMVSASVQHIPHFKLGSDARTVDKFKEIVRWASTVVS